MKKIVTLLTFLFVITGGAGGQVIANAQDLSLKIAVVDTKRVFQASQAMQQVNQTIVGRKNQFQQEFRQKEQGLLAKHQELVRQKSILAPEVFAQQKADLDKQAAMIRSEAKERNKSLTQLRNSGLNEIKKHLDAIIKQIVDARGLNLIFAKSSLVYTESTLDITDEVIKKLNASLPALTLK
ncbi:OmpH family outer membrane protein [Kiloniella majae]|uniref:OmpH family outer membrane protein n=1 Tax=Kiloniella majae TaxID=1938558 RepID=UPI0013028F1E|nr:OmpH family outer membrane protein [Kiloniella majae]